MMSNLLPTLAFAAFMAAPIASCASDSKLNALYPEGPIYVGDDLIFAEMHADRIVKWEYGESRTLYRSRGCGPTAIAPFNDGFLVLCHLSDELHLISANGLLIDKLVSGAQGLAFDNPNDATADDRGGVYFTASGDFKLSAESQGAVLYLDADMRIHVAIDKLHYANGVHFDLKDRSLYVSEHLGRRIWTYKEISPGHFDDGKIFADLSQEIINISKSYQLAGPDGLETDGDGFVYAAIYGTGLVIIMSPEGGIVDRLVFSETLVTNIALSENEFELAVTAATLSKVKPFRGSIRKMPNPRSTGK